MLIYLAPPLVFSLIQYSWSLGVRNFWVHLFLLLSSSIILNKSMSLSLNFYICKRKRFSQMIFQYLLVLEWNFGFFTLFSCTIFWEAGCNEILNPDPGILWKEEPPVPARQPGQLNNAKHFSPSEFSICFCMLVDHEVSRVSKKLKREKPWCVTVHLFQKYQEQRGKWFFYLQNCMFCYLGLPQVKISFKY